MERDPWWGRLPGDAPLLRWQGPAGVKPDGGGSVRGQGRVGRMLLHRAAHNRDAEGEQMKRRTGEKNGAAREKHEAALGFLLPAAAADSC
jgi:hypothetical protein